MVTKRSDDDDSQHPKEIEAPYFLHPPVSKDVPKISKAATPKEIEPPNSLHKPVSKDVPKISTAATPKEIEPPNSLHKPVSKVRIFFLFHCEIKPLIAFF
ncbi:unnamed protein product [Adineta steineri]|uniref:Uncharacterized protein n=1 Tax=Adineta steineri TaxID=433720 RepID=A0A814ZWX4_9BILA|nr:unnamed protein product [Adineta steineri]